MGLRKKLGFSILRQVAASLGIFVLKPKHTIFNISLHKHFIMHSKVYCFLLAMLLLSNVFAQDKIPGIDKSPLDISYSPANYPVLKLKDKLKDPLIARVVYSRPAKNGRDIFCDLVEYDKIWRLGANEATEIEFYKDVVFNKTKIKKGRYTLYAIPYEKKWTIVINKETDTWGAYRYDVKKDVIRMDVPVETLTLPVEFFSIVFETLNTKVNMEISWDNVKAVVPFTYLNNK